VSVRPTFLRPRRPPYGGLVVVCLLAGLAAAPRAGATLAAPSAVAAPPEITVTITGTPGLNGWYVSNVTVDWQVEGETSSSGCDTVTLGADTPGTKLTCSAESGGDQTIKSVTIKLDKTPPAAVATADRLPDANGWYNQPLTVSSAATDLTAGVASCSSAPYSGPDNASAIVIGSCDDNAGNSAGTVLAFKYDATAPSLTALRTSPANRAVDILWSKSADTRVVEVARAPGRNGAAESIVFRGLASRYRDKRLVVGRKYHYRVTGFDQARNTSERVVDVVATGPLLRPRPGRMIAPGERPRLAWVAVKRASYYNVQLYRKHKILSVWPARPSFQLGRTWVYRGHRYRLRPGVYRWYVWPGFGRVSAARYGRLLGRSTFVVSG